MVARAEPDSREAGWIARVVAHDDHGAFERLVRLHQSPVRLFLRRLTRNDTARADDLAQETFWKAYRHIAGFEGRGSFLSWLFRIAYQLFITEERRRMPGTVHEELSEDVEDERDEFQALADRETFDKLILVLRPEECAALVLHYRQELTHPEIADTLGMPVGSIKSLIRRARQKLIEANSTAGGLNENGL